MSSAEYAVESVEEREMVQLLRMGDAKLKQILLEGTAGERHGLDHGVGGIQWGVNIPKMVDLTIT